MMESLIWQLVRLIPLPLIPESASFYGGGTTYQELLEIVGDVDVVAIEDLDNNGYKDIVCQEQVFFNQGNREFIKNDHGYWPDSKFSDLDGDNILDSVTRSFWKIGSDGARYEFSINPSYFEIIDMNNDGRLDVVGERWDIPLFFWYENTGVTPLFGDKNILSETEITPCDVFDYDYDGDDDLLVDKFINDEGIVGIYVNNEGLLPLDFMPLFETMPEGFPADVSNKIIDIDSDGDWDMFGYNFDSERFFVVEQIGYRSLNFEFNWISDKVMTNYWVGYLVYQNSGETYYYFRTLTELGVDAKGSLCRTPIIVQQGNAVSHNWELFQ